jgi:hypothetical protein
VGADLRAAITLFSRIARPFGARPRAVVNPRALTASVSGFGRSAKFPDTLIRRAAHSSSRHGFSTAPEGTWGTDCASRSIWTTRPGSRGRRPRQNPGRCPGRSPSQSRAPAPSLAEIVARHPDRVPAIAVAFATSARSFREIAEHFGVHLAMVGQVVRNKCSDTPQHLA